MKKMTKMDIANSFFAGEGSNGIRVIPFQTEHDSQGTEENVEGMDDKALIASAWKEARSNFRFNETKKEWVAKRTHGVGLGQTTEAIINEEADKLAEEALSKSEELIEDARGAEQEGNIGVAAAKLLIAEIILDRDKNIMQGCMLDYLADMGEPIHPNWVAWTQGDEKAQAEDEGLIEAVMDRRDEVPQEREDRVKPKIELVNWMHIERMGEMRLTLVSWFERNIDRLHEARDISGLRDILSTLHQKRDESFYMKAIENTAYLPVQMPARDKRNILISMERLQVHISTAIVQDIPALKRQAKKEKKAFNLNAIITMRTKRMYYAYEESRKLTFEQHKHLKGYIETLISLLESVNRGSKPKVTFIPKEEKRDILTVKVPSDQEIERIYILTEYSDMTCNLAYYRQFWKEAKAAKDREWVMWAIEKGQALKTRITEYEKQYNVSSKDLDIKGE